MESPSHRSIRILAVVLVAVFSSAFVFAAEKVQIVSLIKGDAFKISSSGIERLVVLYGVQCPSITTRRGKEAKDFAIAQTESGSVSMEVIELRAGLTYVVLRLDDGTSLNEKLLLEGFAKWDKIFAPNEAEYGLLEATAKENGIGIWFESGSALEAATNKAEIPREADSYSQNSGIVAASKRVNALRLKRTERNAER